MRYPNGKLALDGVDLTVRAGELVTILGSNGSGKTTLLRCIARLQNPTEGQVLVGGQDLAQLNGEALRQARLALAMVFQRANLVRRRSVLANVASGTLGRRRTLWTTFGGLPPEELPVARELLRKVGVERLGAQRAALVLKNVDYVIEAHFELTEKAGADDTVEKHYNVALRRLRKGQHFHAPCLGTREFGAKVELIEDGLIPESPLGNRDRR